MSDSQCYNVVQKSLSSFTGSGMKADEVDQRNQNQQDQLVFNLSKASIQKWLTAIQKYRVFKSQEIQKKWSKEKKKAEKKSEE